MPAAVPRYIGRFAPSPTGPLHFGSLIAAVGSYLQAKSQQGLWLLRIEDIDTPRVQPGAADEIMRTLEQYGLHWDGPVWYQSQRLGRYQDILDILQQKDLVYGCQCTRKQIQAAGSHYRGTCANKGLQQGQLAWRLHSRDTASCFTDSILGEQHIAAEIVAEDYLLKRRDGLFSYQLAVVADDIDQHISEVIRGADLLELTTRQQALCRLLQAEALQYGHLPLAMASEKYKISKQNHAKAVTQWPAPLVLSRVLTFLGQPPPAGLSSETPAVLLQWATEHWDISRIPRRTQILNTEFS